MGYDFHIRRRREELISEDDWRKAVEETRGVRLAPSEIVEEKNPHTGERITYKGSSLDAEVWDADEEKWVRTFRFREGKADFRGVEWYTNNPVARAARRLSKALGAKVVGDEGETYGKLTEDPEEWNVPGADP